MGSKVRSKRKAKIRVKEVIKPKILFGPKEAKENSPNIKARIKVVK